MPKARGFFMPETGQTATDERSCIMTMQEFFAALKEAALSLLPQSRAGQTTLGAGAGAGALLGFLFGGLDQAFLALCLLCTIDFFTGWAASGKEGTLKSSKGRKGIAHKVFMFGMVALCALISAGMGTQILRDMAICAYSANEGLSILENVDRLGYGQYIPSFMAAKIAQIRETRTGGEEK
jgi:toxin secretion/phage lysis holin